MGNGNSSGSLQQLLYGETPCTKHTVLHTADTRDTGTHTLTNDVTHLASHISPSYSLRPPSPRLNRWVLLPPQHTHLFLDRYSQLPHDFRAQPPAGDAAAAARWAEGSGHLIDLVQVRGAIWGRSHWSVTMS